MSGSLRADCGSGGSAARGRLVSGWALVAEEAARSAGDSALSTLRLRLCRTWSASPTGLAGLLWRDSGGLPAPELADDLGSDGSWAGGLAVLAPTPDAAGVPSAGASTSAEEPASALAAVAEAGGLAPPGSMLAAGGGRWLSGLARLACPGCSPSSGEDATLTEGCCQAAAPPLLACRRLGAPVAAVSAESGASLGAWRWACCCSSAEAPPMATSDSAARLAGPCCPAAADAEAPAPAWTLFKGGPLPGLAGLAF